LAYSLLEGSEIIRRQAIKISSQDIRMEIPVMMVKITEVASTILNHFWVKKDQISRRIFRKNNEVAVS
jgi:hypothetical protein